MIGIIGAMDDEIQMYFKELVKPRHEKWNVFTFHLGSLLGNDVVLVKSGVGKVFSAMVCQHLIDTYKPSIILYTGVAGSINKKLEIGDVVVGTDSVHHDFDATDLGFKRGQISYTEYRFFAAEKNAIKIALTTSIPGHKIMKGRILTGDQFYTQAKKLKARKLFKELGGDCIEMEGAAVAQVCTMNKVPHLIIRTVSDKADGTAVEDYNRFKHIVANNSFLIVKHLLRNLPNNKP